MKNGVLLAGLVLLVSLVPVSAQIGIARDVSGFEIICPTTTLQSYTGDYAYGTVVVKAKSDIGDSVTVGYNCPIGNSSETKYVPGNGSTNFAISSLAQTVQSGCCNISATWKAKSSTCCFQYSVIERPNNCGNGNVDIGETCVNCPEDIPCGQGTFCNTQIGGCMPSAGYTPKDTGNTPNNGTVTPRVDWLTPTLVIALIAVICIAVYLFIRKNNQNKKVKH